MLALGLDARELQFFRQDFRQLIKREIDLHDVLPRLGASLRAFALTFADDVTFFAVARPDAAGVIPVAKVREVDAAHGDGDEMLAFLADQFTLGEELAQVLPDPAL